MTLCRVTQRSKSNWHTLTRKDKFIHFFLLSEIKTVTNFSENGLQRTMSGTIFLQYFPTLSEILTTWFGKKKITNMCKLEQIINVMREISTATMWIFNIEMSRF